ncbi:hypothetical protein [Noviherbaspirillum sp. Root189]|uniref:hypothetical protein n=1 Tax=Noviherbaspirillum sp. Root189 TaxID=1736487 RepID=UPI0012E36D98|nr:hypothetical protein [Noviherbaspirillum sp. Root189]
MRVQADAGKRKFRHIGFADDGGTGNAQALHHRRISFGRWRITQNGRARHGRFTGNVHQVLDRYRQARKR